MTLKVPNSMIRHVCYQTNYRLPQLERLAVERAPKKVIPITNIRGYTPSRITLREGKLKGNLPRDDYRFFLGTYGGDNEIGVCRWCGIVTHSSKERREHGKSTCKCSLVELYGILLIGKKCAICNAFTGEKCWGLPLCKDGCQNEWMVHASPTFKMAADRLRISKKEPISTK
jgi:hypothetical protein